MEIFKLAKAIIFKPPANCHICYEESGQLQQKPCLCIGSVGQTHQSCLQQEVMSAIQNHSNRLIFADKRNFIECSICKHPIEFSIQFQKNKINQILTLVIFVLIYSLVIGFQVWGLLEMKKFIIKIIYITKFDLIAHPRELCEDYQWNLIMWCYKYLANCSRITIYIIIQISYLILFYFLNNFWNKKCRDYLIKKLIVKKNMLKPTKKLVVFKA